MVYLIIVSLFFYVQGMHSKLIMRNFYFGIDFNELRRKLARGEEEQADKIREFNEEVQ